MTMYKVSYTIEVELKGEDNSLENFQEVLTDIFFDNQVGNIDSRIVEDLGISIEEGWKKKRWKWKSEKILPLPPLHHSIGVVEDIA